MILSRLRLCLRPLLGSGSAIRAIGSATSLRQQPNYEWQAPVALRSVRCFSSSGHYRKQISSRSVLEQQKPSPSDSYTTAFAIFEGLWEAGVKNCFVNVGSDHPSILEAFVKGKRERPNAFPRMITCPSEVTAISMADGYARIWGQPQAVLVHVDVGTQALGQGIHNASLARVPVFILAGLCPFTESGELPGSRTEYSNWLQDAHDQTAIVRQYCRYTGEIRTGLNVKQMIGRALQFAKSAPKGPVYLTVTREILAEETKPISLNQEKWVPIGPSALPPDAIKHVATALVQAERPLIITGYSGRDRRTPKLLVALADLIPGIRIHDTGGSDMCFPATHPASEGFRLSMDECTKDADAILLLDCDIPWLPSKNPPDPKTKVYHVDIDPLNEQLRVSFFPANGRWRADSFTALKQLIDYIEDDLVVAETLEDPRYMAREARLSKEHQARFAAITAQARLEDPRYIARAERQFKAHQVRLAAIKAQARLEDYQSLNGQNVGSLLRSQLPLVTTFVVEAVTNSQIMHDQLQPNRPGKWINCGATGIGWSNGAALGVKLARQDQAKKGNQDSEIVCQIVGDGSFMCAAPSSSLWVASKHKIPILTVLLNNGGWKAPRNSVELVYPDGLNKSATEDELNISFRPSPNYAALAEAAVGTGSDWMKAVQVRTVGELKEALRHATSRVGEEKMAMFIEVLM